MSFILWKKSYGLHLFLDLREGPCSLISHVNLQRFSEFVDVFPPHRLATYKKDRHLASHNMHQQCDPGPDANPIGLFPIWNLQRTHFSPWEAENETGY